MSGRARAGTRRRFVIGVASLAALTARPSRGADAVLRIGYVPAYSEAELLVAMSQGFLAVGTTTIIDRG